MVTQKGIFLLIYVVLLLVTHVFSSSEKKMDESKVLAVTVIHVEDYIKNSLNALLNIKFVRLMAGNLARVPLTVIITFTDDDINIFDSDMKLDIIKALNVWSVVPLFKHIPMIYSDYMIALDTIKSHYIIENDIDYVWFIGSHTIILQNPFDFINISIESQSKFDKNMTIHHVNHDMYCGTAIYRITSICENLQVDEICDDLNESLAFINAKENAQLHRVCSPDMFIMKRSYWMRMQQSTMIIQSHFHMNINKNKNIDDDVDVDGNSNKKNGYTRKLSETSNWYYEIILLFYSVNMDTTTNAKATVHFLDSSFVQPAWVNVLVSPVGYTYTPSSTVVTEESERLGYRNFNSLRSYTAIKLDVILYNSAVFQIQIDDNNNRVCVLEQAVVDLPSTGNDNSDSKGQDHNDHNDHNDHKWRDHVSLGIQRDALYMVQARIQHRLYNCELLSGALSAFPTADFLDLRLPVAMAAKASNQPTSAAVQNDDSRISDTRNSMTLKASSYYHRGMLLSDDHSMTTATNIDGNSPQEMRSITSKLLASRPNIQLLSSTIYNSFSNLWINEVSKFYPSVSFIVLDKGHILHEVATFFVQEWIYSSNLQSRVIPPCVLVYDYCRSDEGNEDGRDEQTTKVEAEIDTEHLLRRLGYLSKSYSLDQTHDGCDRSSMRRVYLAASYCESLDWSRLTSLVPNEVLLFLNETTFMTSTNSKSTTNSTFKGETVDSEQRKRRKYRKYDASRITGGVKIGLDPKPIAVLEQVLSDDVLALLEGRLLQIPTAQLGSTSFFHSFSDEPRSLIEYLIDEVFAPTVLGQGYRERGYVGAEWWVQLRGAMNPKEYHLDTAITWCRDNGWPHELLKACHFYPAIGTVFYLSDFGGPTVVFDQNMTDSGVSPVLPKKIGVVPPRRNRLLAFDGSLYHGVVKENVKKTFESLMPRLTLLVNYWSDKSAGESDTPLIPSELAVIDACEKLLHKEDDGDYGHGNGDAHPHIAKTIELSSDREFFDDFLEWKEQELPKGIMTEVEVEVEGSTHSGTGGKYDEKDVVLIHYDTKTDMFDVFEHSTKSYVRWMDWGVNVTTEREISSESNSINDIDSSSDSRIKSDSTSKATLTQVHPYEIDVKALREWRSSMPGGDPFLPRS